MIDYIKNNFRKILLDSLVIISNLTIIISYFIIKQINNLDEIWNFNTARQIMNGLIPYKEISMITTPFLPSLNSIFLKIFGDELFIFRIISAVIITLLLFVIYKIMSELLNNRKIAIISIEGILILYISEFCLDYNFFSLLLLLNIILVEIKINKINDSNLKHLLIGILSGLAICTKQTIGIFIATFCVLLPLITDKQILIKDRIKKSAYRVLGICIPIIIFVVILIITNSLVDFIDYAILGIKTFKNVISYKGLLQNDKTYIKVLSILIPIIIIAMMIFELIYIISKKLYKNDSISKMNILILYSFPMLVTIYPIADTVHFLIAVLPVIIVILYIFFKAMIEIFEKINIKDKRYISNLLQYSIIFLLAIFIIKPTIDNYKNYEKSIKTNLSHYTKLSISQNTENIIENLRLFYNDEKHVILLDAAAAIYNIPLNKYNKNYDMFLKGNIGKNGEEGIIKEIQNSKDCVYLVKKKSMPMNWQTPTKVIDYVRKNLQYQGTVDIFDIYYKD